MSLYQNPDLHFDSLIFILGVKICKSKEIFKLVDKKSLINGLEPVGSNLDVGSTVGRIEWLISRSIWISEIMTLTNSLSLTHICPLWKSMHFSKKLVYGTGGIAQTIRPPWHVLWRTQHSEVQRCEVCISFPPRCAGASRTCTGMHVGKFQPQPPRLSLFM